MNYTNVHNIYKLGPTKIKLEEYGIDSKNHISNNFFDIIDEEAKMRSQGSEQYPYFVDGTKNPFHTEALQPAYSGFLFSPIFRFVPFGLFGNAIIKFSIKNILKMTQNVIGYSKKTIKPYIKNLKK